MRATDLRLAVVELPIPTADAQTILRLDVIFGAKLIEIVDKELYEVMNEIIEVKVESVPDFDFNKIQSITASKSFGSYEKRVNGSWFTDLNSWGKGMYPGPNLKDETVNDFRNNIIHIEKEGFLSKETLEISHYEWLERYVATNTGGSHHAAKIVFQSLRDGLTYKRRSLVKKVSINREKIQLLENKYQAFIYKRKNDKNEGYREPLKEAFEEAIYKYLKNRAVIIDVHNYYPDIKIIFIPLDIIKDVKHSFNMWKESGVNSGRLIPLNEYLKAPNDYHKVQYSHGIDYIMLRNQNDYYI